MNRLSKRTLGFYLLAIFVAGAATGLGLGYGSARRQAATPPPREMADPTAVQIANKIQARLEQRLGLTSAQAARIRPLVEQSCLELESIHTDSWHRISETMCRLNVRIAEHLTPGQREKLGRLDQQLRDRLRVKCGPHVGAARAGEEAETPGRSGQAGQASPAGHAGQAAP